MIEEEDANDAIEGQIFITNFKKMLLNNNIFKLFINKV